MRSDPCWLGSASDNLPPSVHHDVDEYIGPFGFVQGRLFAWGLSAALGLAGLRMTNLLGRMTARPLPSGPNEVIGLLRLVLAYARPSNQSAIMVPWPAAVPVRLVITLRDASRS